MENQLEKNEGQSKLLKVPKGIPTSGKQNQHYELYSWWD